MGSYDIWPDERLFDAWNIRDVWIPKKVSWPEEMSGWSTREKELWGITQTRRFLFAHVDGARVMHRGDCPVWVSPSDCSMPVVGDIDLVFEGRSPILEVKATLPAVRLRGGQAPACQGLDWPARQNYLNEQHRTGRPFYVCWVWPDREDHTIHLRGARVDLLDWPPHESSLNRLRGKGARMAYWYIDRLWPMSRIIDDIRRWGGEPFQESLLGAA